MVFSSMVFLFLFLTATLAIYFLVPARRRRARNLVLNRPSLYGQHKKEPLVGNIEF